MDEQSNSFESASRLQAMPTPTCAEAIGGADRLAITGQLAAGFAHEMNTPLGIISAHAEEILDTLTCVQAGSLSEGLLSEIQQRLHAIMRQSHRCGQITMRLQQFAKFSHPRPDQLDLDRIIEDIVQLFLPAARRKGVNLTSVVEGRFPPIRSSASEIEQLLASLVQNALDACTHGDSIRLDARSTGKTIQLTVADSGSGMSPEHLQRVFDPFFTTKPVGTGTGLGLSVCYGIVNEARGTIKLESRVGEGTTVVVVIPMVGTDPV